MINRCGIELAQLHQADAIIKQTSIKKIRAEAAGFGFKFTETQYLFF